MSTGDSTVWKWIAAMLASLVATMCIGWFTIVRDMPTRTEVMQMIEKQAPYAQDREAIRTQVERNSRAIDRLEDNLQAVSVQQARIEAKLDILLERIPENAR